MSDLMEDMDRQWEDPFYSPFETLGTTGTTGTRPAVTGPTGRTRGENVQGDIGGGTMTTTGDFGPSRGLMAPFRGVTGPSCSLDVKETKDNYLVDAAMPGYPKDRVKVTMDGNILTLEGQHREEKDEESDKNVGGAPVWHRREISRGSFKRSLALPKDAKLEDVRGRWDEGILHLSVPRRPEQKQETKKRHIPIEG